MVDRPKHVMIWALKNYWQVQVNGCGFSQKLSGSAMLFEWRYKQALDVPQNLPHRKSDNSLQCVLQNVIFV